MHGTQPVFVGDAKYKKPDASDHYQLHAYMRAYGVSVGALISPDFAKPNTDVLSRFTHDGLKTIEIYLPLSNLDKAEESLARLHEVVGFRF